MVYLIVVGSILFIYWFYWVMRMINPWKFTIYLGKKGCGKSSILAMLSHKKQKAIIYDKEAKWYKRFHTVPLKVYANCELFEVEYERYNPADLGIKFFPDEYSVLYCDEMSLYWYSRNWKSLDERTRNWFVNMRKTHNKFIGFSQDFNIDRSLRLTLCDRMYLVKSFMITWSVIRLVDKKQTIKDSALDSDSQLVDSLKFAPIFMPGRFKFIWLPRYIKLFNTNERFSRDSRKSPSDVLLNDNIQGSPPSELMTDPA